MRWEFIYEVGGSLIKQPGILSHRVCSIFLRVPYLTVSQVSLPKEYSSDRSSLVSLFYATGVALGLLK